MRFVVITMTLTLLMIGSSVGQPTPSVENLPARRVRYEYMQIFDLRQVRKNGDIYTTWVLHPDGRKEDVKSALDALNRFGDDGWELVTDGVPLNPDYWDMHVYTLKRVKR